MAMQELEFTKIVRETKASVLSAIAKTLRPEFTDSIDDVVQETYLRAYNSLRKNQFRHEASINTWIYTIARNEALRANKKLLKTSQMEQILDENQVSPPADDPASGSRYREILGKLLPSLPAKYKTVLELDILGLKDWEIAEKLKISIGTVKSRNSRAREKVKQLIHYMKLT